MSDEYQPVKIDTAAAARLETSIGRDLLEFTLNADMGSLVSGAAPIAAISHAQQLDATLQFPVEGVSNPAAMGKSLQYQLTDASAGQPLALAVRSVCGGVDDLPETSDAVETLLVSLAHHVYPGFLVPDDFGRDLPWWANSSPMSVVVALHHDPLSEQFEVELMKEKSIAKAFTHTSEHIGTYAMVHTSAGSGGSIQLRTITQQVFSNAWRGAKPSVAEFAQRSMNQLKSIREAFAQKTASVPVRLSFTGALLPSTDPYVFGDLTVRAATDNDYELAPEALRGQLTGSDSAGTQVTTSYAGDVVAEFEMPYVVRASKQAMGAAEIEPWPEDLLKLNNVEATSMRLRASLLLATQRAHRTQIAQSWQLTEDPLTGPAIGWSLPEQFVGLMPTALGEDEVTAWAEWYGLLSAPDADRIALAISRIVRATGERRDPVDVLIDSVIAWENLFGTKDGEPTLRVTASLAILLEPDPSKRRVLRSRLAKIYGMRSDAVHGTALPKQAQIPLCFEALDIAIAAVRTLVTERPDVLAETDGGARSLKLILGESTDDVGEADSEN